jgi:Spy/CpxP family protein refolding chaperone
MKTSHLPLFLLGLALALLPPQLAMADNTTTAGQPAPAAGSTNSGTGSAPSAAQGERFEKFKELVAQLNLTDAQKDQIKQIRATVTDRKERRQQIMAVLTPEQKAKLKELIQERRSGA